jgi:hypothetical protein
MKNRKYRVTLVETVGDDPGYWNEKGRRCKKQNSTSD